MDNILNWYVNGERGISSETMAAVALGKTMNRPGYPHDPADLNRCIKLVDAAPEVKEAFPVIAALSPMWATIIANWDDLRNSFIEEVGYDWSTAQKAPLTYNKMDVLLSAARQRATA